MIIRVVIERSCTEEVFLNVEDLNHVKELLIDSDNLWNLIAEQEVKFEEVVGEVLDMKIENEIGTEFYELNKNNQLITENYLIFAQRRVVMDY